MHSIYLIENGEKAGPFTLSQLREKMRGGNVTRDTLGWQPGMTGWGPVGEIGSVRFEFEKIEDLDTAPEKTKVNRSSDEPAVELTEAAGEAGLTVNPRDAKAINALPEPRPWRRFWARMIDIGLISISALVIGVVSGALAPTEAYRPSDGFFLTVFVAWIFLESGFLMILGTTPGKFLVGIRLRSADGAPQLTLRQALGRSFMVWWRGFGLGLIFAMVIACTFSHYVLKNTRTTPWDSTYGTEVSYTEIKPWRMVVLGLAILGLFKLLEMVAGAPPKPF